MSFWRSLRAGPSSLRDEACCTSSPKASVPIAEEVPALSPARLLEKSLTNCETRGEWEREYAPSLVGHGWNTTYTNKSRSLKISRSWWFSGFSGGFSLSTPFTLTKAEEQIVTAALEAFDNRAREDREAEALARLTAPREGLKPLVETTEIGSTAKPRKPGAKHAPKNTQDQS